MTEVKILARDIILQVAESDGTTWTEIGGLTAVKPNFGENEETANTTDYDSDGEYSQLVMQRGASLSMEGKILKDNVTGIQNAGQARCEVISTGKGYASRGKLRFRHPLDTAWKVWDATFSLGEQGGETNDTSAWACTATRCDASTTVAVS